MKKPMLPIKEYFKSRSGEYMAYDQVSLLTVSIYKTSSSLSRLTDKVFIDSRINNATKTSEAEFNAAYAKVMSEVTLFTINPL